MNSVPTKHPDSEFCRMCLAENRYYPVMSKDGLCKPHRKPGVCGRCKKKLPESRSPYCSHCRVVIRGREKGFGI